jgi:hypothetical protein
MFPGNEDPQQTSGSGAEVAKAAAATLSQLLPAVYWDGLAPGVRQVGAALESVLGLLPLLAMPAEWLRRRSSIWLERNLIAYAERLADVPSDRIRPVPPEIGVPLVSRLAAVADEVLAQRYVELLDKASVCETQAHAHPGFLHKLDQLSPDEARLLPRLRHQSHPCLEARLVRVSDRAFWELRTGLTGWELSDDLAFVDNLPLYLTNMESLGLLRVLWDRQLQGADYATLEATYRPLFGSAMQVGHIIEFERGGVIVTELGSRFVRACLPTSLIAEESA